MRRLEMAPPYTAGKIPTSVRASRPKSAQVKTSWTTSSGNARQCKTKCAGLHRTNDTEQRQQVAGDAAEFTLMLVIVGASIAVFWMSSTLLRKRPDSRP